METWRELLGDRQITVAGIIDLLNQNADFKATLPDSLAVRDSRDYSRRLGNALARKNGVRYPNGLMIAKDGKVKHAAAWRVVSYGVSYETPPAQADLATDGGVR